VRLPKPSHTERKRAEQDRRRGRQQDERDAKAQVRRRDRICRFPGCGCKRLHLRLEVAHVRHKGAGGNPAGDRNDPANLLLLCTHRHRYGRVSLHAGTLRVRCLTARGTNGPVAWDMVWEVISEKCRQEWVTLAEEARPGLVRWDDTEVVAQLSDMKV